jgi:hypothetical protein
MVSEACQPTKVGNYESKSAEDKGSTATATGLDLIEPPSLNDAAVSLPGLAQA